MRRINRTSHIKINICRILKKHTRDTRRAVLLIAPLGTLKRIKQDEAQASYYPMIKKEDGLLDFNASAGKIVNFVRGMTPWPGAYCF